MTKYHQQAQARSKKRISWRAELKQDKGGSYTLVPEKIHKESTRLGSLNKKDK